MLGNSNAAGVFRSKLRRSLSFSVLLLPILLLFGPSFVPPNRLPAPSYDLVVSPLPKTLCAGERYDLTASVQGRPIKKMIPPHLEAVIDNPQVASLTAPAGFGGDEDELFPLPNARLANLSVYALAPGKATLTITTRLSAKLMQSRLGLTLTMPLEFEVIHCKYLMDLDYTLEFKDPLGYSHGSGKAANIELEVDPETRKVTGRGEVNSTVMGGWDTPSEVCEHDPVEVSNKVNVGGELRENQLVLQLYFLPSFFPVVYECSRIELSGAKNPLDPYETTNSLFGPIPVLNVTTAADGAARTFPTIYPPAPDLEGETTIQVVPDEGANQ